MAPAGPDLASLARRAIPRSYPSQEPSELKLTLGSVRGAGRALKSEGPSLPRPHALVAPSGQASRQLRVDRAEPEADTALRDKLDDLFLKRLITAEEYERLRAAQVGKGVEIGQRRREGGDS
jgi:hypothetical protein